MVLCISHASVYFDLIFTRDSIGLYAIMLSPVRLSHGWISQKRFDIGSCTLADPGFAKGGREDHGERAERERKRGSGGGAPSRVQGQSPWWRVRGAKPPP